MPNMPLIANLRESHYYHIPSQGNIYTVAHLEVIGGPPKILVATLKRDIFCIEYQELSEGLLPTTKEVSFTYIPSNFSESLIHLMENRFQVVLR